MRESVTPGSVHPGYGLKWWLAPYGNEGKLAWAGSGFGGQVPIAIPEHDLLVVVTAWNVTSGRGLGRAAILNRILGAITR